MGLYSRHLRVALQKGCTRMSLCSFLVMHQTIQENISSSISICLARSSQKQHCLFCRFAGVCVKPPNDRVQDRLGAGLLFAQFVLFETGLCLAGLQACSQGVPWWSSRMTGRPSRPVLASALAFFARSWTTTAKACRLASQPCQPPEVEEPACQACPWLPVICFCPLTVLWEKQLVSQSCQPPEVDEPACLLPL